MSSCEVLHFLRQQEGDPGARLLPFAFHLLARQALGATIEGLIMETLPGKDIEAARRLGWVLQTTRLRPTVLGNQLHMTANRLGLRNAEEIYVARLLWRTVIELGQSEPSLWDRLGHALSDHAFPPPGCPLVEDLLPEVLGTLATFDQPSP